jgi:hypothetical protein
MDNESKVLLVISGLMILLVLAVCITGFLQEHQYNNFCKSEGGRYFQHDKCVVVIDDSAVRYGIAEVNNKLYLYRWGVSNG